MKAILDRCSADSETLIFFDVFHDYCNTYQSTIVFFGERVLGKQGVDSGAGFVSQARKEEQKGEGPSRQAKRPSHRLCTNSPEAGLTYTAVRYRTLSLLS